MPQNSKIQTKSTPLICPWKWLVGNILLIALIITVQELNGWRNVLDSWRQIPVPTLLLALSLFALSHALRALRIYELIFWRSGQSFALVAKLSALHQFANNLLPMRLGEGLFPILLKRHFGISWAAGLSRLIWLRLMDLFLMGMLIFGILMISSNIYVLMLFCGAAGLGLVFIVIFRSKLLAFVQTVPIYTTFRNAAPSSYSQASRLFLWTVLAWTSKLSAFYVIVQAFLPLPSHITLAGVVGAEFSSVLPLHGVAGAGSFEAAFIGGVAFFGFPEPTLVELAVNVHIFMFCSTLAVALILSPVRSNKNREVKNV